MERTNRCVSGFMACLMALALASCGGGGGGSSSSGGSGNGGGSGGNTPGTIAYTLKNQDTAAHAPPSGTTADQLDYNAFTPNASNFPPIGYYYFDPVFGAPIRRLTNVMGSGNNDDIYAHHWANADGTYAFTRTPSNQLNIIKLSDGSKAYTSQPLGDIGYEIYWDAQDANKYYYYSGANLMVRNLSAQTSSVKKTFPSTLQALGGSLNFQSRDGYYFVVQYSGSAHVWNSQTDTIYSGTVAFDVASTNGWVSITPDGNYVVTSAHYSYAIDHNAHSVATTGLQFWNGCGDHGVLTSASNGKNYFVTHNCYYDPPGVVAVDITTQRTAQSDVTGVKWLLNTAWADNDGHLSAVSRGAFQDWVFVDTEYFSGDGFNSMPSSWTAYRQEIVATNVVTGQVRRLAQHRSRGLNASYYNQPRISCSWDGSAVLWTSNYNVSSPTGYADMYSILDPIQ